MRYLAKTSLRLWLLLSAILLTPLLASAAPDAPPVVRLSLEAAPVMLHESKRPEGTFVTFEGTLPLGGEPGQPALPVRREWVAVPERGTPIMEVTLAEAQPLATPAHPLAPVPTWERVGSGEAAQLLPRYRADEATYAQAGWFPANPVILSEPTTLRGTLLRRVDFFPVQVNPATGALRWTPRAEVTLRWPDAPPPSHAPANDGIARLVSNPAQAAAWQPAPHPAAPTTPTGSPEQWMLEVEGEGIFRVTLGELAAAGVDVSDPSRLALFYGTPETLEEQAILIEDETLYFVNGRAHGEWSKRVAYRLQLLPSGSTGKRMVTVAAPPNQPTTVSAAPYEQRVEQDKVYQAFQAWANSSDRWFWKTLIAQPVPSLSTLDATFDLPHLDPTFAGDATLTVEMGPIDEPPLNGQMQRCHYARITVNGAVRGTQGLTDPATCDDPTNPQAWYTLTPFDQVMTVPQAALSETGNQFQVATEPVAVNDKLVFNSFTVRYQRALVLDGQALLFDDPTRQTGTNYQFTSHYLTYMPLALRGSGGGALVAPALQATPQASGAYLALEVSTLGEPRLLLGEASGNHFAFGRPDPSAERYLVTRRADVPRVAALHHAPDSGLRSDLSGADYLVITHPAFAEAIQPLVSHRAASYRVRVATTDAIYRDFGSGATEPEAIRAFLQYAYQQWDGPAPQFALLVGDATYDPFNVTGSSPGIWVPPLMRYEDPNIGYVPADHAFVVALDPGDTPQSDPLPDIEIGRLPVNSPAEAATVVQKLVGYDSAPAGPWQSRILLTTDDIPDTAGNFHQLSDSSAALFPATIQAIKAYLAPSNGTSALQVRDSIVQQMNNGVAIVQYIGHGSVQTWAAPAIWTSQRSGEGGSATNDLALLTPTEQLAFSLPWTCWEGYFIHPSKEALSEQMLRLPGRGTVGAFAPVGLDVATGHDLLTQGFYQTLFDPTDPETQLGPLLLAAKLELVGTPYERLLYTYMLHGDPAMHLQVATP